MHTGRWDCLKAIFVVVLTLTLGCGFINYNVNGTIPLLYVVSDLSNHRVLLWTQDRMSGVANIVLGQPSATATLPNTGLANPTSQTLKSPRGAFNDGQHLVVADSGNNRVLIWNTVPSQTQQPADLVLGQPDFTTGTANTGGSVTATTLSGPESVYVFQNKLFVADRTNNRVLIWNSFPTQMRQPADIVLGQSTMGGFGASLTAQGFSQPGNIFSDGQRLYVSDIAFNRVLIWNSTPTTNQQAADLVLGQPSLTCSAANANVGNCSGPTISAQGFLFPTSIYSDGRRLVITDFGNNRVLIWNSLPSQNQQPADVVLGQAGFSSGGTGAGATGLSSPGNAIFDGQRFFVSDFSNNRVLAWNSFPTSSQQPADLVFGQPDFNSVTANAAGVQGLNGPLYVIGNGFNQGVWRQGGY